MSLISELRQRLGPAPRQLQAAEVQLPRWAREDSVMTPILNRTEEILCEGDVVIGWVFMANSVLWEPGDDSGSMAGVVYSFDEVLQRQPYRLQPTGDALVAYYGEDAPAPVAAALQRQHVDELRTGFERPIHARVAPAHTAGRVAYHTSVFIPRACLPAGHITTHYIPLMIEQGGDRGAVVLPARYWPSVLSKGEP